MTQGRPEEVTISVRVGRWKVVFLVTVAIAFAGCMTQSLPFRSGSHLCRLIQTDEWIGLSNGLVRVGTPGLKVGPAETPLPRTAEATQIRLPARLQVTVPPGTPPGNYYLKVSGDCLPLKRWLIVKE